MKQAAAPIRRHHSVLEMVVSRPIAPASLTGLAYARFCSMTTLMHPSLGHGEFVAVRNQ
jgi:hypothetical protein